MTEAYVNSGDLSQEALALKKHGEELLNIYKGECSQALELSTECLQVSGLNTQEFFRALEKIYTNLSERITEFADFLTNVVVVEYEAVNEAITQNFNNKFAQEISSTLGIPMPKTGGLRIPKEEIIGPPIATPIEDIKKGGLSTLPGRPVDRITVPRQPRNERFEPVLFEESGPSINDSIPASSETTKSTEVGTVSAETTPINDSLPNRIPMDKGNTSPTPVYFDEGNVAVRPDVLKPAVEPTPTTIGSSAPASVSTPVTTTFLDSFVKPTISTSSETFTIPLSTLPVATVPRPVIVNTSSTGIKNGKSIGLSGVGI